MNSYLYLANLYGYADDTKISIAIQSPDDALTLQNELKLNY